MTKIDSEPRRRRVLAPVAGAFVAAVAAGAVLYGTLQPAGKGGGGCPVDSARLAASLKPLATGDLSALQVMSEPRRPGSFAFERPDGDKATLADFKGRAVLFNLWATWCAPCRAEMPALDRLEASQGGPGFQVVAVNVDTARLDKRAAFLDGKGLGLPVTLVIDKDGCELASVEGGAKWDSADAQALVQALKGG